MALNDVASLIAPMTLADLHFGRDPFAESNQQRSRVLQLCLTIFALLVLVVVGHFMHSLQQEQDALVTLEQIQELKPQQKLTAVRKMAQWEGPLGSPNTLYDQYHQKIAELVQINNRVSSSYTTAVVAYQIPLFPLQRLFSDLPPFGISYLLGAPSTAPSAQSATGSTTAPPPPMPSAGSDPSPQVHENVATDDAQAVCVEEPTGVLRLPKNTANFPKWMKDALRDSLSDFCFQLNVVAPGGNGALLTQSLDQLSFVSSIKDKVSLRINWFLPFLYGLLGSAVFMMRSVASVRTPATEWLPIAMRISLGGVAGIVIGWFSTGNATSVIQTTTALSLPFALAFLTGYGIELLFTLLDRVNRAIGTTSNRA